MHRSNPTFVPDQLELEETKRDNRYQIPRVKRISESSSDYGRYAGSNYKENTNYDSKGIADTIPINDDHHTEDEDDEKPDYSLLSYLKYFDSYRNFEKKFKRFSKRVNLNRILWRIFLSIIFCLYIVFFIFALAFSSKNKATDDDYWCDGDGFLIIITSFAFVGLFYFKIFKPFVMIRISNIISDYMSTSPEMQRKHKKCQLFLDKWYIKLLGYLIFFAIIVVYLLFDTIGDRVRLISAFGIIAILFIGFIFSAAPRKVIWRHVIWGMGLQFVLGYLTLRWSTGRAIFQCFGNKIATFLKFTDVGSTFVFGKLVSEMGVLAFTVLTVIFFFGFFIQIFYYWGVMQWIVIKLGWVLQVTIGTTACESVNAAANIFLSQSSAPLLIKPYLADMTKSELHAVMTGGMATIAGTVLAAYISFGISSAHLMTASVMSAPAALAFSKLFYPELEQTKTDANNIQIVRSNEVNVLHAGIEGVTGVISVVACVTASLIAFISAVAFFDAMFGWFCLHIDLDDGVCSLSNVCGYIFTPLAWVMGVPWQDCYYVGQLIGTKMIINEFVAYSQMSQYIDEGILQDRSQVIATYALCGFSNIASIGILISSLGAMAPSRKDDLARIGFRAMIAANFACFLTACVAGTLLPSDTTSSSPIQNSTVI